MSACYILLFLEVRPTAAWPPPLCAPAIHAAEALTLASASIPWIAASTLLLAAIVVAGLYLSAMSRAAAAVAQLGASSGALDVALLKIRSFAESQRRFVGNLAREIDAPLATARVQANLLLASIGETALVERYARSLAEDMGHLSGLVQSFLRLVSPVTQDGLNRHVPVPFHDVVLEAVSRCKALAASRFVTVVPTLAETNSSAVEVLGDAVLLESMIENLLRNALLAAPRGTRVDLRVIINGDEVLLSVRDRGASIDKASLDIAVEEFFQVPTPARPVSGTRLSLAIARRVAEHHHGSLSLRNLEDGGCLFEVQLPRWRSDGPTSPTPL